MAARIGLSRLLLRPRLFSTLAEVAPMLHIPLKTGPKNLLEVAAQFPGHGVGMKFLRKVKPTLPWFEVLVAFWHY